MKKIWGTIAIIILALGGILLYYANREKSETETPAYVEKAVEKESLISVESPAPYDVIESPLTVVGQARGSWYSEARFPIIVTGENGDIVGQGYAEAESDWMTEEFVPFIGTVSFSRPASSATGHLILKKANPSGIPDQDDAIDIPIIFTE